MNRWQGYIGDAEVRELWDPTTGGIVHVARYGPRDPVRQKAPRILQMLPLFAYLSIPDRAAQGAALTEVLGASLAAETGASVIQAVFPGFRGSSLRYSHMKGIAKGDLRRVAISIASALVASPPYDGYNLKETLIVAESLPGDVAAEMGALGLAKNISVLECCGMNSQSAKSLRHRINEQNKLEGAQRAEIVDAATAGLKIDTKFNPRGIGVRQSLPVNPAVLGLMFTDGFGVNCAYHAFNRGLESFDDLQVNARFVTGYSPFPAIEVRPAYVDLHERFGDRFYYEEINGETHYTVSADPQKYAELVARQAIQLGVAA